MKNRILLVSGLILGFATFRAEAQGIRPPATKRITADSAWTKPAIFPATVPPGQLKYNYYQSLGAACKAEYKVEKATGVPFRFRLGSLAQTDYMERKPNALKP